MTLPVRGTLYGSLTSPYVRLCRIVRERSGASQAIAFEKADAFVESYRAVNPIGRVPALIIDDGPIVADTPLIVRTLMDIGGTDLLPADPMERLEAEADIALAMGVLDLGVAYFLETKREPEEQSPRWLDRRLAGVQETLSVIDASAARLEVGSLSSLAFACMADWLGLRMEHALDWRAAAPRLSGIVDQVLAFDDVAATDPRLA
ncbi:MAG: glutathione S-transferase N-terminal domain-containing protein [Pseudomonadota bacterium]